MDDSSFSAKTNKVVTPGGRGGNPVDGLVQTSTGIEDGEITDDNDEGPGKDKSQHRISKIDCGADASHRASEESSEEKRYLPRVTGEEFKVDKSCNRSSEKELGKYGPHIRVLKRQRQYSYRSERNGLKGKPARHKLYARERSNRYKRNSWGQQQVKDDPKQSPERLLEDEQSPSSRRKRGINLKRKQEKDALPLKKDDYTSCRPTNEKQRKYERKSIEQQRSVDNHTQDTLYLHSQEAKFKVRTQETNSKSTSHQAGHHPTLATNVMQRRYKRTQNSGTVTSVNHVKKFGFIAPDGFADMACRSTNYIHLRTSDINSGNLEVEAGDAVEFFLGQQKRRKPHARYVKLLCCKPRSAPVYVKYFGEIQHLLSNRQDIEKQNAAEEVINCRPVWEDISHCLVRSEADHRNNSDDSQLMILKFLELMLVFNEIFGKLQRSLLSELYQTVATQYLFGRASNFTFFVNQTYLTNKSRVHLLHNFFEKVFDYVPERGQAICGMIQGFMSFQQQKDPKPAFLWQVTKTLAKHQGGNTGDADWDKMALIPAHGEFIQTDADSIFHLQRVKRDAPYKDENEYMDTYFRLLRHDCFSALRDGIIKHNLGTLDSRDLSVYVNIQLKGVQVIETENVLAVAVYIEPQRHISNWQTSKNLMFGNLVCLSATRDFQQALYAIVYSQKFLQEKQVVLLEFLNDANRCSPMAALQMLESACCQGRVIMAESPTFYRAYQPVLKALQESQGDIAFKEEIVSSKNMAIKPNYLKYVHFDYSPKAGVTTLQTDDSHESSDEKLATKIEDDFPSSSSETSMVCTDILDELAVTIVEIRKNTFKRGSYLKLCRLVTIDSVKDILKAKCYHMTFDENQLEDIRTNLITDLANLVLFNERSTEFNTQQAQRAVKRELQKVENIVLRQVIPNATFDRSQLEAVKHSLSNRLAIIQGPPGTGKTFIGTQLVKVIHTVKNKPNGPILVVTYKNHGLDEFMKELLRLRDFQTVGGVLRVGKVSQPDPKLEECTLKNVTRNSRSDSEEYFLLKNKKQQLQDEKKRIEELFSCSDMSMSIDNLIKLLLHRLSMKQLKLLIASTDWRVVKKAMCCLAEKSNSCIFDIGDINKFINSKTYDELWNAISMSEEAEDSESVSDDEFRAFICDSYIDFIKTTSTDTYRIREIAWLAMKQWLPPFKEFVDKENQVCGLSLNEISSQIQDTISKDRSEFFETPSSSGPFQSRRGKSRPLAQPTLTQPEKDEQEVELFEAMENERKNAGWSKNSGNGNLIPLSQFPIANDFQRITLFKNATELLQKVPQELVDVDHLNSLDTTQRVFFTEIIMLQEKTRLRASLAEHLVRYQATCKEKAQLEIQRNVKIMQRAKVVGMTITGASIHKQVLAALRPAIVFVEEAAEVLEPQITALLGPWVQHLILIGDHKQLRPKVETYKLTNEYNFDLSLMERMINNDMPYATLTMQNRMRPEFAELLIDIYPDLESNFKTVSQNEAPLCVAKSMFFWNHSSPETADRSYSNEEEANMAVQLALFFIKQHHPPQTITILGAYKGQVKLLRAKLKKAELKHKALFDKYKKDDLKEQTDPAPSVARTVIIHTIDNYQGDENDIVIVSLVRSNLTGNIGFLGTLNRLCVAQSRAKRGMYFIGNAETLMKHHTQHWKKFIYKLKGKGCVAEDIPLLCPRHQDNLMAARGAGTIDLGIFCKLECRKLMPCGKHTCKKECQSIHDHNVCEEVVEFFHPVCKDLCDRKCCEDNSSVKCCRNVDFTFKHCGHPGKKKCFETETDFRCKVNCLFKFQECGHMGTRLCYFDQAKCTCAKDCARLRPDCKHPCMGKCWESCTSKPCSICENEKREEAEVILAQERETRLAQIKTLDEEIKRKKTESKRITYPVLKNSGSTAQEYLLVHDFCVKSIEQKHNKLPIVKEIQKISNPGAYLRWLEARRALYDPVAEPVLKFHPTSTLEKGDIGNFLKNWYNPPDKERSMFNQQGRCFPSNLSKCAPRIYTEETSLVILTKVLLGKAMTIEPGEKKMGFEELHRTGFDSLYVRSSPKRMDKDNKEEIYINKAEQALPQYVVEFHTISITNKSNYPNSFENKCLQSGSNELKKYRFRPKRSVDLNDEANFHFWMVESQFLRLNRSNNYSIESVEYYIKPELVKKFQSKENEFRKRYTTEDSCQMVLAFHGTSGENVMSIFEKNFSIEKIKRGVHGWGIYFSEFPDISLGYGTSLLLCKVLPGKCHDGSEKPDGFDSNRVRGDNEGRGEMLVIYNPDQILPCYLINYKERT